MPKSNDIEGIDRAELVRFSFNGDIIEGFAGESVAAALLRAGIVATRHTTHYQDPRGYYCGMGVCWECVVEVAGVGMTRSCMQPVADGLDVKPAVAHKH
jgi:sarcosine oxidase subunit alpha